MYIKEYQ